MEKNRTNLSVLSQIILFTCLLVSLNQAQGQKMKTDKDFWNKCYEITDGNGKQFGPIKRGHCGIFYKTMDALYIQKEKELDFYQFQSGQVIASIGAQCCHWEAAYAATTDSLTFYLEDIDTTYFKRSQADFAWHYYDSIRERPMTSQYKMIVGDERSTSLPENIFDKILIINSFHEFTYQAEMLADIKKKLKSGGLLYIDEAMPKRPGQLHGICKKPMLTDEEMIAVFDKNGFEYVDGLEMNFRKNKPQRKIFAFQVKK